MSEVKRYGYLGIVEEEDGEVVKWEDYAAVKAERDALAAELSAVEVIHDECAFVTDDDYEACPEKVQKIIRNLAVMQIPATDAYLSSVRAEGVEMFAAHQRAMIGKPHKNDAATSYAARCAVEYAAQLRAGKDGE